ncbi:hypothetical protein D3C78_1202610 [compost metagenome]
MAHHVHLPARPHGLQQRLGDLFDTRPQGVHRLQREGLVDQATQAAMTVAIAVEHVVVKKRDGLLTAEHRSELRIDPRRVTGEALVVQQHLLDFPRTGDVPHRQLPFCLAEEHRGRLAQRRIMPISLAAKRVAIQIEGTFVSHEHSPGASIIAPEWQGAPKKIPVGASLLAMAVCLGR